MKGYNASLDFGCFMDKVYPIRDLSNAFYYSSDGMSVEICIDYCQNNRYKYAGLQYGYNGWTTLS
jgi:hypothetical protein